MIFFLAQVFLTVFWLLLFEFMAPSDNSNSVNFPDANSTTVSDLTPSVNSESGKPRVVQCFPRHDTLKLDDSNFIQ